MACSINVIVNLIRISFIADVYFFIMVVETLIILSHYHCCYHHTGSSSLQIKVLPMLPTEFFGEIYSHCTSRFTETLIPLWRHISFWVMSTTIIRHLLLLYLYWTNYCRLQSFETTSLLSSCLYSTLTGSQLSPIVGCACLGYTPKKGLIFVTSNTTDK